MAGYDRKRLTVSHDRREPVSVTIEVDPAGYSAHWVRLTANRPCKASATFTYE